MMASSSARAPVTANPVSAPFKLTIEPVQYPRRDHSKGDGNQRNDPQRGFQIASHAAPSVSVHLSPQTKMLYVALRGIARRYWITFCCRLRLSNRM